MQVKPVNPFSLFYHPSNLAYAVVIAHLSGQSFIPEIRKTEKVVEVERKDARVNAVEPARESTLYYRTGKFLDFDKSGERLDLRC